jgi:phosphatidylserine/phosphatidylglycerophosphate/cardiolipin synthase-like enzyme
MFEYELPIEPFEFDYEMEEEWETGKPDRSSREYIRRVQQSLNQILGLNLSTDGIMGARTRSAIRSFQQKRGLGVDGIVGAQTEAAIKVALSESTTPTVPMPSKPSSSGGEDTDYKRWFETGGTPAMQPIRAGNDAKYLIDGRATFAEMVRAIRTATTSDHYIYLLAWRLSDDFELIAGDSKSTMASLLATASSHGVQVRAMLSDHVGNANRMPVVRLNALTHGAAIHDDRFLRFGSHHQKILIVKGSEGLITFCGGIDIVANRVVNTGGGSSSGSSGGGGSPLHDVHCRIVGPAALDLLRIFLERWTDHPDHGKLDTKKGVLLGLKETVPGPTGKHIVQIGRTYGNGAGYRFAPKGEQTAKRMILKAIREARQFIYIEDQYLVSMELSRALQAALPRIQHLTIVMPDSPLVEGDMRQPNYRRQQVIAPLKKVGGSKVRVFVLSPPGSLHTYVHAKLYVVDDRFAIIGSANGNRRSFTHDSEVTAGIFDAASNPFAQQLRVDLWAEHLNMHSTADRAKLADGVAGARYWLSPPAGARIAPYNENANIEWVHTDVTWDNIIDPDGS